VKRQKRKRRNRAQDVVAYRRMIRRILAGEVADLYWRTKGRTCPVKIFGNAIWVSCDRAEYVITPRSLARDFQADRITGTTPDRMAWATEA